jgi:8-oxo-dGTP pyrophosphatase MutT (NUDIX family)/mannose-6-phosphate isomerase-like protein (cupin superfamily)
MTQFIAVGDDRLRLSDDRAEVARLLDGLHLVGNQREVRDRMRGFLDAHPDALLRSCTDGHFTGSALVVDATAGRVLFLFHVKHQRWLQPGGHADGDANLVAVALREATEETGIEGLRIDPDPIDLDIHPIPARGGDPAHLHLDARFLVVAPPGAEPVGNHESHDIAWFPPEALAALDLDAGTLDLVETGLARAREVIPVIENPRTGEQVEFVHEDAEVLVMRSTWTRPGHRAVEHIHPGMQERFEVLEGRAAFRIDGSMAEAGPGDVVIAEPGQRHLAWNPTDTAVRLRIEMRPPLRWAAFTRRFFAGEDPVALLAEFAAEIVLPGRQG